jgi:uncharacterized protein YjbI with pentapeptide repeats
VLLLGKRIGLPLFDVEIPLDYFYVLAPALLVLLHLHLLILWYLMLCKVQVYVGGPNPPEEETDLFFSSLPLSIYLGHSHPGMIRLLLALLSTAARVVIPSSLLLATQLTFLPYHSRAITGWHQLLLLADIALVWYFALCTPDLSIGREAVPERFKPKFIHSARWKGGLGIILTLVVVAFSIIVAGGRRDVGSPFSPWNFLLKPVVDLSVVGRVLVEAAPSGESLSPGNVKGADLVGRDLRGADFTGATLINADFRGAYLVGAVFSNADLRGAKFSPRVDLSGAHMEKANLDGVDLQQADLRNANLREAKLRGTNLGSAQLTGADLWRASLQGADLRDADLRGAKLIEADAIAVDFSGAKLLGADLRNARLYLAQGMVFEGVDLRNAHLGPVEPQCGQGNLVSPILTDLRHVDFLTPAEDTWTDLQEDLPEKGEGLMYTQILRKIKRLRARENKLCLVVLQGLDPIGQDILSMQIERATLLYNSSDLAGSLKEWPTPRIDEAGYYAKLAQRLVDEACDDDGGSFANALVRDLSGELPPRRSFLAYEVARKMSEQLSVEKDCRGLKSLSKVQRNVVERVKRDNPWKPGKSGKSKNDGQNDPNEKFK